MPAPVYSIADITVTDVSPAIIPADGGRILTLTGIYRDEPAAVYLERGEVSHRLYSGRPGLKDSPVPDSPTLLVCASPVLDVGFWDLRVVQDIRVAEVMAAVRVVAPMLGDLTFQMRRQFPRWYAVGERDFDVRTLPLVISGSSEEAEVVENLTQQVIDGGGAETEFDTPQPYQPGKLAVYLDGVLQNYQANSDTRVTETDPNAGTFTFGDGDPPAIDQSLVVVYTPA